MAYFGDHMPDEYKKTFDLVAQSRDLAIDYIKNELKNDRLPLGKMADRAARDNFDKNNVANKFLHSTGHSIGTLSPHGRYGHLRKTNHNPLKENLGYTIEPGLYFDKRFGVRSELDFYFSNKEMVITTPIQTEITII